MKYISKFFFIVLGLAFVFAGCDKVKDLPYYKNGNAPILSSTVAAVAAAPSDSSNNVISFLWTSPKYSTDANTVKFIVQIDSAGRNFSNAASRTINFTVLPRAAIRATFRPADCHPASRRDC